MRKMRARNAAAGVVLALAALTGCQAGGTEPLAPSAQKSTKAAATPPIRHVFVVNLENKSYAHTFGPDSPAPYLSRTLPSQGALLTQFYGIAHHSLGNYLAQISGQAPNPATQADCRQFTRFVATGWQAPDQAVGTGCYYPTGVRTIANQLDDARLTWRGYMEDMGSPCRRPALDEPDTTQAARPGDQYAARHNPFVYFQAISPSSCRRNVVDLDRLQSDLSRPATTRNLTYITPNLCNDGHDSPCVDGQPGGLESADAWLRTWVPRITSSPAFEKDGVLVVTFDEAETNQPGGSDACCGQGTSPNTEQAGREGPGGGRIGAVVLSPFVEPGTRSAEPYNQYSLLRTMEAVFGLPGLGYASTVRSFGGDVWTRG